MQGLVSEDGKDFAQVRKFMSFAEKIRVEEFLENRQETNSTITRTSDSGVGTWSPAPTECRSEEGAEGSRKEKFDHVEEWVTEAIENLDNVLSELKTTTQSEVVLRVSVKQAKQELEKSREKIHNWNESGYEIPVADSKMALVFGEVEEYIFSPELSAEGVLQKVKTILQINQDMFEHPNEDVKKLIRLVAKTAKKLNRIDVFDHLREYAPPGTTGPRLSDDSTFADIPLQTARKLTMALSGKDEWTMIVEQLGLTPKEILFLKRRTTNPADAALAYVSQKLIISVGSLYDLLNENRLPMLADFL
nr:uncharacterized protein LOC131774111 [Pocillopora verrucosa]